MAGNDNRIFDRGSISLGGGFLEAVLMTITKEGGWSVHIKPDPVLGDREGADGMMLIPLGVMDLMGWKVGSHLRLEVIGGRLVVGRYYHRG